MSEKLAGKNVYIENIADYEGDIVTLRGWLYNKRSSGKLHFLQVRDGTGIIQAVVFKGDVSEDMFHHAASLTQESSLILSGKVTKDSRSVIGYEIQVMDLKVIQIAQDYPITPKDHGIDFLMNHRHLWLRSKKQASILRIRSTLIKAIRDYFDNNGFTLVDTPIFTPSACEGTTSLFEVDYFEDQKAYLAQSGQLYAEAGAMALGKVYCFGPTFRAEKSKTRRHLTEFWMVEPEVAYNDNDDNMDLAEDFVCYIVQEVLQKRRQDLEVLERDLSKLENITKPFPRISYDDAIKLLKEENIDIEWGEDFGAPHETEISKHFDKPVMIYDYPKVVKAFYMKQHPTNPNLVRCVDMIAPEGYGEMIGGSQREDNLDILLEKIKEHDLHQAYFEWYLDLRRYGTVPHAGFGLGVERTLSWICGIHHVRETIPFPRLMDRLTP